MGALGRYAIVEWLPVSHPFTDYRRDLVWREQGAGIDSSGLGARRVSPRRNQEHGGTQCHRHKPGACLSDQSMAALTTEAKPISSMISNHNDGSGDSNEPGPKLSQVCFGNPGGG